MRLVMCDDNRILCEALAAALEARGHQALAITTTADDGVSAVATCRPDVCILDLRFPSSGDGLAAARTLQREHPETKVLVLSAVSDPALVRQALEAGVAGFVRKDQNIGQIADALDVIAAGGFVLDANVPRQAPPPARPAYRQPPCELTPREREVLGRIAAGQGTNQMAFEMQIATSTLRTYVKSVLIKLGAHTRLQAAALASRDGALCDVSPDGAAREKILHLT